MAFNKRKPGRAAKIGPREAMAIREDYATGFYSQPQLAVKYGIGPGQIGKIIRGEAWVGVTQGIAVVTQQEIEMRETGMIAAQLARETQQPIGTNYLEREVQQSLERLKGIAPDLFEPQALQHNVAHGIGGLEAPQQKAVDERMAAYMRMMTGAELEADSQDGTTVRREQVMGRMEESLAVQPGKGKGKVASINAENLLETLKDETDKTRN